MTQLLFDHALRLRMKESTEEEVTIYEGKKTKDPAKVVDITTQVEEINDSRPNTPEEAGTTDGSGDTSPSGLGESSSSTAVGGSLTSNKKGKNRDRKAEADDEAQKTKGQGLAGKINVLMAADVEAVLEGEFIMLSLSLVAY